MDSVAYQMQQAENQPRTNAEFKIHAWPNPMKSRDAKRPIYDQIEVCVITHPGDKQTIKVFPATEVWKWVDDPETGMRVPLTYAMRFNDQYLKFKSNEQQTASGTPLEALSFLTVAKRLELKALHVHTAEALAALDGMPLKQLGVGGRDLKNKATAYLEEAEKAVDVDSLRQEIERLKAQIAGTAPPVDELTAPDSAFADMDDESIKEWIKDATGARPKGNPSRATLISMADELNAEIAAKRAAEKEAA